CSQCWRILYVWRRQLKVGRGTARAGPSDPLKSLSAVENAFFDPTREQQNVLLIESATFRKVEKLIESCQHCNAISAEIPFDWVLDRITGSDSAAVPPENRPPESLQKTRCTTSRNPLNRAPMRAQILFQRNPIYFCDYYLSKAVVMGRLDAKIRRSSLPGNVFCCEDCDSKHCDEQHGAQELSCTGSGEVCSHSPRL